MKFTPASKADAMMRCARRGIGAIAEHHGSEAEFGDLEAAVAQAAIEHWHDAMS